MKASWFDFQGNSQSLLPSCLPTQAQIFILRSNAVSSSPSGENLMAAKQDGLWLRLFVIVWHTTWQHAYLYDWQWNKRVPTRPDLSLFSWDASCRAAYSLCATDEKLQRCTGGTMSLWKREDFPVFFSIFFVFFLGGGSSDCGTTWFIVNHHQFKLIKSAIDAVVMRSVWALWW